MSEWKARRFWKSADVVESDGDFTIHLDGRPVRTPAKSELRLPTEALAAAVASEWDAQTDTINPITMPLTRAANSAIDKVMPMRAEVITMLAEYGDADVVCYRALAPEELVVRQQAAWDPLLDWAAETFGARLIPVAGVIHHAQDATSLERLAEPMKSMSIFHLAGFHDLVTLSGSLVIATAVAKGHLTADEAWSWSRIDEDWQIHQWGEDDEASALARSRQAGFHNALRIFHLSTKSL